MRRVQRVAGIVIILGGCLTLAIIGTIQVSPGSRAEQDYSISSPTMSPEVFFWTIVATCTLAIIGGFLLTVLAGRRE